MKTTYPKLPKVFKKKWLEALRSGDYEQGKARLLGDGKYCCLGVACDIAGHKKTLNQRDWVVINSCSFKNVPNIIRDFPYTDNPITLKLSNMNDSIEHPKSFTAIANWIDKNL